MPFGKITFWWWYSMPISLVTTKKAKCTPAQLNPCVALFWQVAGWCEY
ncbi:MAG: hypothetical protein ACE5H1_00450 [Thermodesulfobacteriota bacterium]